MLLKITRQNCLSKFPKFPRRWYNNSKDEIEYFYPKVFHSYILTLHSKTFKGHIKLLGQELVELIKSLGFDSLLFLGDTGTPWLYQQTQYAPVLKAIEFLEDNKIGKRFNGAIQVSNVDLLPFVKHLSWLS